MCGSGDDDSLTEHSLSAFIFHRRIRVRYINETVFLFFLLFPLDFILDKFLKRFFLLSIFISFAFD